MPSPFRPLRHSITRRVFSLRRGILLLAVVPLFGCSTPTIDQSHDLLWQRFGQRPVDEIIVAWGAPHSEAKLTDGTRVLTYRRQRTYWRDFQGDYTNFGDTVECDASFFAPPPAFHITSVTLAGDEFQCADMAQGASGTASPPAGGF